MLTNHALNSHEPGTTRIKLYSIDSTPFIVEIFVIQPTADYILVVKCAVIRYTGKVVLISEDNIWTLRKRLSMYIWAQFLHNTNIIKYIIFVIRRKIACIL
jgi:hypothetical protein